MCFAACGRGAARYAIGKKRRNHPMMFFKTQHTLLQLVLLLAPLVIGFGVLLRTAFARKGGNLPATGTLPERRNHHVLGIIEGISFLLLMGVAVPIKRMTGDPTWVTVVGSLHGALFVLYVVAVILAAPVVKWRPLTTFLALAASVLPFGTFAFEWYLGRQAKAEAVPSSGV